MRNVVASYSVHVIFVTAIAGVSKWSKYHEHAPVASLYVVGSDKQTEREGSRENEEVSLSWLVALLEDHDVTKVMQLQS